jgi:hypothetical protein
MNTPTSHVDFLIADSAHTRGMSPLSVKKNHDARVAAEKINSDRRRRIVFTTTTKEDDK